MRQQWRFFKLALMYFTIIPVSNQIDFDASEQTRAMKFFPLIGVLVGGVAAVIYCLSARTFPSEIAVFLSIASSIYLTGCLHEDGLSDTADGLGGGSNTERILDIMRDSRIGSFGATGLILVLYGKLQTLSYIPPEHIPASFIASHSLSRLAALALMSTLPYLRQQGKAESLTKPLKRSEWLFAAACGLTPLVFLPAALSISALLTSLLTGVVFTLYLKKRIGGYTGDCLGAMQQLAELAFYLGLLANYHS